MAVVERVGKTTHLPLRLVVDKSKSRVVYAQCDRFMADVLFSFLTTPVGALVRRTGKDSGLGCMDSLYQSVEDMDAGHFRTRACRRLLLRPRSAFGFAHHRLRLWVNDAPVYSYGCPSFKCEKYSLFEGSKCACGLDMTMEICLMFPGPFENDVVFVRKDLESFVVTDDLFIAPSSDALKRKLCNLACVDPTSRGSLEERMVLVDNDQIIQLMKSSLHSNTPLTDTFLPSNFVTKPIHWPLEFLQQHLTVTESSCFRFMNNLVQELMKMLTPTIGTEKMAITLFHDGQRVHFARGKKNFIDLLFSFLVFPFGSIVTAAGGRSSLGCLDNLHQVVKRFLLDRRFYLEESRLDICRNYLPNPPIALHHGCRDDLLNMGKHPFPIFNLECESCDVHGLNLHCKNINHSIFYWKPINPKCKGRKIATGGGYMRRPETFIITNNLVVKPIHDLGDKQFATGLVEKSVDVGKEEALKLLMASLVSKDPLSVLL